MNIVVGSTLPGLLKALDSVLQGRKGLMALDNASYVLNRVADPQPIDVLVLDDRITPIKDQPIQNSLWEIMYLAATQNPPARVLLVMHEESFPTQIREPLAGLAQEHGGGAYVLPRFANPRDDEEAVRWIMGQLDLGQAQAQHWIMPLSGAGGVGKSSQMANLAITLSRRGLRVLVFDADFANGSLSGFFKVPPGEAETFLTLREEFPQPVGAYPREAVTRRIYNHQSGIDLLLSGRGLVEIEDLTVHAMRALIATIRQLPYDIVCLDAGPDIKARPYAIDVLRSGGTGLVVAQPGRKERRGAENVLELMRAMAAPGKNASLLSQAAIIFVEAEHGSVAQVDKVHRDITRQYGEAKDLGIVPRDARLLSQVAERQDFCTVFELDPSGKYCRALEEAATRLAEHMRITVPAAAARGAAGSRPTASGGTTGTSPRQGFFSFLRRGSSNGVPRGVSDGM